MSNLQVPQEGELGLLDFLKSFFNLSINPQLALYNSNLAYSSAAVLADYDAIECTFPGYARVTLNSWGTVAVPDGSGRAYVVETLRTFIASSPPGSPETIYGYYVRDDSNGRLLWVQAAAVPRVITLTGDNYSVIPKLTLLSEF